MPESGGISPEGMKAVLREQPLNVATSTVLKSVLNGDFEYGSLSGWEYSNAQISTDNPHEGVYCAKITNINGYLRQWLFEGIPYTDLPTITVYARGVVGNETLGIEFIFSDGGTESYGAGVAYVNIGVNWRPFQLRPSLWIDEAYVSRRSMVVGLRIRLVAGTNCYIDDVVIGRGGVYTTYLSLKTAIIDHAGAGDNTIVAAVINARIKVYAITLVVSGAVNCRWKSGALFNLSGDMNFGAAGQGYSQAVTPPAFLLATQKGEALVLNLSGATAVDGYVSYWDDDRT